MTIESGWLGETKKFFLQGVAHGWAGGNNGSLLRKSTGTPGMEEWREAIYRDYQGFPGFELQDRWGVDPDSGRPSGHIFITHWQVPVWGMWVGGGAYDQDVFPFLREALMVNYHEKQFHGGRGLSGYSNGALLYTNEFIGDFHRFEGVERIKRIGKDGLTTSAGFHEYWGGSFVFLPRP